MAGDGDGWVHCAAGHRHWGRFGAAGLLINDGDRWVLQHRAPWTHEGGTWALPGGARDSHEDPVQAALREAVEEAAVPSAAVRPIGMRVEDHGGWSYTTVLAAASDTVDPHAANPESTEVRWWATAEVDALPKHEGFARAWPLLRTPPVPVCVVVDVANVVGARPDGWWRDREGAATRLLDRLGVLCRTGIPATALPRQVDTAELDVLLPTVTAVLEGAAGHAQPSGDPGWWSTALNVRSAAGSGDDEIVRVVGELAAQRTEVVLVTADRGLRERVAARAVAAGPSWLLDLLDRRP